MTVQFLKLTAKAKRDLEAGQYICEHNIKYLKLAHGDGLYSVYATLNGSRIHRNVGRESEGVTLQQAIHVLEKLKTDARTERFALPQGRKYAPRFKEQVEKFLSRMAELGGKNIDRKREHFEKYFIPFFKDKAVSELTPMILNALKNLS